MNRIIIFIMLFSISVCQVNQHYVSSNTRALSMGGAFTSVADPTNSILWNPATNIIEKDRQHGQYRQFGIFEVDVVPAVVMIVGLAVDAALTPDCDDDDDCDEDEEYDHDALSIVGIALPYAFRGGSYYGEKYHIQLKLNEELADFDFDEKYDPYDNSQNMLSIAYQFGREWAIGYTQSYFVIGLSEDESLTGWGNSFGIAYNALRVSGLSYGLTYFNFPNNMKSVRAGSERLIDKSINFGMSYQLESALVSVDIRNLFKSEKEAHLEIHSGIEWQIFRVGGFFVNNETDKFVPSYGLFYRSNEDGDFDGFFYRIGFSYSENEHLGLQNMFTLMAQINF